MKIHIAGPLIIEKYKTIIYNVSGMRMYSRNILQWRKIKTKARILPTGDYLDEFFCSPENDLSKMLLPKPDLSNSERFWNGIGRFLVTFLGSAGWTFLFLKNKPSKLKVLCMSRKVSDFVEDN